MKSSPNTPTPRARRFKVAGACLLVILGALFVPYAWLALRPTGYRSIVQNTPEEREAVVEELTRTAADLQSSRPAPAAGNKPPRDPERLKHLYLQYFASLHQFAFHFDRPLELFPAPTLIPEPSAATDKSDDPQVAAAREAVAWADIWSTFPRSAPPDHTFTPRELADIAEFIEILGSYAGNFPPTPTSYGRTVSTGFSGADSETSVIGFDPRLARLAIWQAGLRGETSAACRMIQNVALFEWRQRLGSYRHALFGLQGLPALPADLAASIQLDDASLVELDAMLREFIMDDGEFARIRALATLRLKEEISQVFNQGLAESIDNSTLDFMLFNKFAPAVRSAANPLVENVTERLAVAYDQGDLAGVRDAGAELIGLGRLLGFGKQSIGRLDGYAVRHNDKARDAIIQEYARNGAFFNSSREATYFNFPAQGARVLVAFRRFQLRYGREPKSIDELLPEFLDAETVAGPNHRWLVVQSKPTRGPDYRLLRRHAFTTTTGLMPDGITVGIVRDEEPTFQAFAGIFFRCSTVYAFYTTNTLSRFPAEVGEIRDSLPANVNPSLMAEWFSTYEPRTGIVLLYRDMNREEVFAHAAVGAASNADSSAIRTLIAQEPGWRARVILLPDGIPDELRQLVTEASGAP